MSSSPLLKIPNEILLDILDYLEQQERQAALCQLSLVNHQLAWFAKDALFVSPSINPSHARLLAKQLIRFPHLANRIVNLEVLNTWTHHKAPAKCEYGPEFEENDHARQVKPSTLRCLHALRSHGITERSFIWVPWLDSNDCFAYIALVIAISKRLRRLKLSEQYLRALCQPTPANQDKRPFRPYLKSLALWERSLRGLDRLSLSSTGLPPFCNTRPQYNIRYLDFSVFDGNGTTVATGHREPCTTCFNAEDAILKVLSCGHHIGKSCLERRLDIGATNCSFCRREWIFDEAKQDRASFREVLDGPSYELLGRLSDIATRHNVPEAEEMLRFMIYSMLEQMNSLFGAVLDALRTLFSAQTRTPTEQQHALPPPPASPPQSPSPRPRKSRHGEWDNPIDLTADDETQANTTHPVLPQHGLRPLRSSDRAPQANTPLPPAASALPTRVQCLVSAWDNIEWRKNVALIAWSILRSKHPGLLPWGHLLTTTVTASP
ncbi:hypothetical protein BKA63DRAFT_599654 [Paraphoma chrysanthemicola]|nr:hypothetical protein BKA63DRAFT_599654 [Paraphoma chrysanthemicola]